MFSTFTHYLILAALLITAIFFYTVSFQSGTFLVIILGVLFELAFWIKLVKGKKKAKT